MTTAEPPGIAAMRDQQDPDTPLFNSLISERDPDVIDGVGQGWPPAATPSDDGPEPDEADDAEPAASPGVEPEPHEEEPAEPPGDASEPAPDPAPTLAE